MYQIFGAGMLILAATCGAVAAAESDTRQAGPIGVWTLLASDGSTITLSIDAKELTWEAVMPGKGTTTLRAPGYSVRGDVLFGYVGSAEWTDGVNRSTTPEGHRPFACRLKATENDLTLSEVVMFGADDGACKAMGGTYRKASAPGPKRNDSR